MDLDALKQKKEYYQSNRYLLSESVINNYASAFEIEYAHDSTAIDGNTLSLMETKAILEGNLSIGIKNL